MNMLTSPTVKMSSREIAELTSKRHPDVKRDIERMFAELDGDVSKFAHIYIDSRNREQTEYLLDRDHTETLLLSYSAELRLRVVRRLRELERSQVPAAPTTAEAFAQAFRMLADRERQDAENRAAIVEVQQRLDQVERTTSLPSKPQHCETKSEAKARMNKQYGLPSWVSDLVLTTSPYRPPVFGMVKNGHENAQGSSFAVYQIIEVTKLFKRFVSECKQATATTATHPDIDTRFKLTRRN